jgi:hypothetical protein
MMTLNVAAVAQNNEAPKMANRERLVHKNWPICLPNSTTWDDGDTALTMRIGKNKVMQAEAIYKPIVNASAMITDESASFAPTSMPNNIANMLDPSIQLLAFTNNS